MAAMCHVEPNNFTTLGVAQWWCIDTPPPLFCLGRDYGRTKLQNAFIGDVIFCCYDLFEIGQNVLGVMLYRQMYIYMYNLE